MDSVSEARLSLIYPALADKVRRMYDILMQEGLEIRVIQGLRSWSEQNALYAKGRDANGNVVNKAEVVTNAPGGSSWHNYGLAIDCAPDDPTRPGYQIDWKTQPSSEHPQWKRMEAIGESLGLTSGANWLRLADAPHFQITGRFPVGAPDSEARQIFRDGGMGAVWEEVTKSLT